MIKYLLCLLLITNSLSAFTQYSIIVKEENVENAYPRLSENGSKILYQSNRTGKWQLYICDITGDNIKRISNDSYNNNFPDWSPDNNWIVYVSDRDNNEEIYIMRTDGSGVRKIITSPGRDIHPYFSPDGKYILFNSNRGSDNFDIYRYNIVTGKVDRLTRSRENETCARYAPDMKNIVLLKNSETSDDVCVLNMSNFLYDNITKTPHYYHGWPMYSNDGMWVYYSSMENGTYSIYRSKVYGDEKQQLTTAAEGEEHARVCISKDGQLMIFNVRTGNTISIVSAKL